MWAYVAQIRLEDCVVQSSLETAPRPLQRLQAATYPCGSPLGVAGASGSAFLS